MIAAWFGAWAGLSGILGFRFWGDLGMGAELAAYAVLALVIGGGLAGWLFHKPARYVVTRKSWVLAALLGMAIALLALELAVTVTIVALPDDETMSMLLAGWLFAPLLSSPVLLTAGPLCGLGWLGFARWARG